jgi:hypothetical protein
MADQTVDPQLETLLRAALATEVARLPLTTQPEQILARRGARRRSRLRLLIFGEPTSGLRQLSVSLAAVVVLAITGVLAFAVLRVDRTPVAAPLPTTPEQWSRVAINAGSSARSVTALATSPLGLLAVVGAENDGAADLFASTDGHEWTRVPSNQHPPLGTDRATVIGTERGFLLFGSDVWFSQNGFDWQRLASSAGDPDLRQGRVNAAAVGGPGYVAVGSDNKAWYSTDGSDWTLADVPPPPLPQFYEQGGYSKPTVEMEGITVDGDTLFAWGTVSASVLDVPPDMMADRTAPILWASSDGRSWTHMLDGEDGDFALLEAVAGGPGGLVAIKDSGDVTVGHPQFAVEISDDGRAWKKVDVFDPRAPWPANAAPYGEGGDIVEGMPLDLKVTAAAATSAGYVAVGGDGVCHPNRADGPPWCVNDEAAVWTSVDGRSWERMPADALFTLPKSSNPAGAWANEVVAWGSRFVVGGVYDGKPAIWVSGPPLAGAGAETATDGASTPAAATEPTPNPTPSPALASSSPSAPGPTTSMQDMMEREPLGPIEAGTYFIDPDGDPSTPLRVVYDIPADGWSNWIGAAKFSDAGHTGVSITSVANLVTDGCRDHSWADPPVAPSADDLATALTNLAPFEVTSPPSDVTAYGFSGRHLAWTVPDVRFTDCDEGNLKSWVAFIDTAEPGDAFYGYTGPGYTEEFWILDVKGTRLMIAAETSADSPADDIAERDAILDSIRIEP